VTANLLIRNVTGKSLPGEIVLHIPWDSRNLLQGALSLTDVGVSEGVVDLMCRDSTSEGDRQKRSCFSAWGWTKFGSCRPCKVPFFLPIFFSLLVFHHGWWLRFLPFCLELISSKKVLWRRMRGVLTSLTDALEIAAVEM